MSSSHHPSVRVMYIGGVGRSGSTLVERVLNELPGVCGLGEVAQTWLQGVEENRLCGCRAHFRECALWSEIGWRAFGGWDNVDLGRFRALHEDLGRTRSIPALAGRRLPAGRRAAVAEYVDHYRRIYTAAAEVTGARTIVDSSKHVALAFCLRWAEDVDLRVVHLVRDPRGVAHSWMKRVRDAESGSMVQVPRFPVARSALSWSAQNAAFELLARGGGRGPDGTPPGARVLRLRYEEFVADTPRAVDALAAFGGLAEPGEADLSFLGDDHAELGILHSVSGNRMRFETGRLSTRVDDAWRTSLRPGHRWLVGALSAPLLRAYGYRADDLAARRRKAGTPGPS